MVRQATQNLTGRICLDLNPGLFWVRLNDPYWMRLVSTRYNYELELQQWLTRLPVGAFDLIDLGANIGFWPVWFGARNPTAQLSAIEPNPFLAADLRSNVNGLRNGLSVDPCAVVPRLAGDQVDLYVNTAAGFHADSSLNSEGNAGKADRIIRVPARTLDQLLTKYRRPNRPTIVKLDIEGMEIDVLKTSENLNDSSLIIVYEDHGSDRQCKATQWMLSQKQYSIYLLQVNKPPLQLHSTAQLLAHKKSRKVGYNVLALPHRFNLHP